MNLIETIKPDGTDRRQIRHNLMNNPYKIDIFESHIYWLLRSAGSIGRIDKFGRGAVLNYVQGLDYAEDVKVFHKHKYPNRGLLVLVKMSILVLNFYFFFLVSNPCENSGCSHLCLLKPNNDFECACPDNSQFLESDIKTCDACN